MDFLARALLRAAGKSGALMQLAAREAFNANLKYALFCLTAVNLTEAGVIAFLVGFTVHTPPPTPYSTATPHDTLLPLLINGTSVIQLTTAFLPSV